LEVHQLVPLGVSKTGVFVEGRLGSRVEQRVFILVVIMSLKAWESGLARRSRNAAAAAACTMVTAASTGHAGSCSSSVRTALCARSRHVLMSSSTTPRVGASLSSSSSCLSFSSNSFFSLLSSSMRALMHWT
jgi:hypothetical protein